MKKKEDRSFRNEEQESLEYMDTLEFLEEQEIETEEGPEQQADEKGDLAKGMDREADPAEAGEQGLVFMSLEPEEEPEKKAPRKINLHFVILGAVLFILVFAVIRLLIWNKGITIKPDENQDPSAFDVETMDSIIPLNPSLLKGREDDGLTTVVCLGNAPFADDWDAEDNLAALIGTELGENTKIYNCSVADSYMTAMLPTFSEDHPYDAFSFYWMATALAVGNTGVLDTALAALPEVPAELRECVDTMKQIDMDQVDVIAIMYDGSDYLAGRKVIDRENKTDIQYFTGALAAGIQLIQNNFPYIRIMVMSPTYAYALDENGEYASSDIVDYGMGALPTYVILESDTCYENSVSFIDNLYGTVNVNNADQYLTDYIHLNPQGRELVAKRFAECLNMYHGVEADNAD